MEVFAACSPHSNVCGLGAFTALNSDGKIESKKVFERKFMAEKQTKKTAKLSGQEKIRIKLRSYDYRMLDNSVARIVETAKKTGAIVAGPVLLPVKIRKYTVLRSPHTDKKSREQFEMRIHKRLIDLKSPTAKTVDELMKLDLPAGVDVAIKSN